jgi:hypothetical protein
MATYLELHALFADSDLMTRTEAAVVVKAHEYVASVTPTADQLTWAKSALSSPKGEAKPLLAYVLAENKSATVAQIKAASDATLQGFIDTAVDALVGGGIL